MKRARKKVISTAKKVLHRIKAIFRGFTIIELIVVIAVIGVLASIIVVSVTAQMGKAKDSRVKAEISEIAKGASAYYSNYVTYDGYALSSAFVPVCSGSSYTLSANGANAFVVYARLCASDKYWCSDSTGGITHLDNPPDTGVYSCISGAGGGAGGESCGGTCSNCDNLYSESDCEFYGGCNWAVEGRCEGSCSDCELLDQVSCGNYAGCLWYDNGPPAYCMNVSCMGSVSSCASSCPSGCGWNAVFGRCHSGSCSVGNPDELSCSLQCPYGCSWQ